jgi:hypothetical protein
MTTTTVLQSSSIVESANISGTLEECAEASIHW